MSNPSQSLPMRLKAALTISLALMKFAGAIIRVANKIFISGASDTYAGTVPDNSKPGENHGINIVRSMDSWDLDITVDARIKISSTSPETMDVHVSSVRMVGMDDITSGFMRASDKASVGSLMSSVLYAVQQEVEHTVKNSTFNTNSLN